MKIAILGTRGIPARYGGFETFAEQLSTGLSECGHQCTVFCERGDTLLTDYRGVRLAYVPALRLSRLSTVLYDLFCLWRARRDFDVVYMLGYGAAAFCWIPRLWGAAVWINMDGLEWRRGKWNWLGRTYLRLMEFIALLVPSRLIADARGIRGNIRQRYAWSKKPCDVIPYGSEIVTRAPSPALITPWGVSPDRYYLAVCRFEPENHVREIIDGYLESDSPWPLLLVGDSASSSPYVREIVSRRSDPRLRFLGAIYDKDKLTALRYYARGYLHGHSVGGTNPSLLEAMGCSNLVIAHDNIFNREVLSETGLFFKSSSELGAVIRAIETQNVEVEPLRQAAKTRAEQFYTWPRVIEAYDTLLRCPKPQRSEQDFAPPNQELAGRGPGGRELLNQFGS